MCSKIERAKTALTHRPINFHLSLFPMVSTILASHIGRKWGRSRTDTPQSNFKSSERAPRSTQPPSRGDVIRLGAVIDLIKEGESRSEAALKCSAALMAEVRENYRLVHGYLV